MIDTLKKQMPHLRPPAVWAEAGLKPREYFVLTLHRPVNVDAPEKLANLLHSIASGTRGLPVVFPVHPRTRKVLNLLNPQHSTLNFIDPLGYLEFNYLVKHAKAVITDSGGVTEECTVMGVPCLTMRNSTERPETVASGTNKLVGTNPADLLRAFNELFTGLPKTGGVPEKWDGLAAERIVAAMERLVG